MERLIVYLSWVGFAGVAFGTPNNWKGWCLYLGITALYFSLLLSKEDK